MTSWWKATHESGHWGMFTLLTLPASNICCLAPSTLGLKAPTKCRRWHCSCVPVEFSTKDVAEQERLVSMCLRRYSMSPRTSQCQPRGAWVRCSFATSKTEGPQDGSVGESSYHESLMTWIWSSKFEIERENQLPKVAFWPLHTQKHTQCGVSLHKHLVYPHNDK